MTVGPDLVVDHQHWQCLLAEGLHQSGDLRVGDERIGVRGEVVTSDARTLRLDPPQIFTNGQELFIDARPAHSRVAAHRTLVQLHPRGRCGVRLGRRRFGRAHACSFMVGFGLLVRGPSSSVEQAPDTVGDLVADLANLIDRAAGRVSELPIDIARAGDERARIPAAHRHHHISPLRHLWRQQLRPTIGEVDVQLTHDLDNFGMYPLSWGRTGRPSLMTAVGGPFKQRLAHLRAPGVVQTDKENVQSDIAF